MSCGFNETHRKTKNIAIERVKTLSQINIWKVIYNENKEAHANVDIRLFLKYVTICLSVYLQHSIELARPTFFFNLPS